jgi:hypothetical protein
MICDVRDMRSPCMLLGAVALVGCATTRDLPEAVGESSPVTPRLSEMGLTWLAAEQSANGYWGVEEKNRVLLTSVVTAAFLSHGETPARPTFGPTVKRALRYLLTRFHLRPTRRAGLVARGGPTRAGRSGESRCQASLRRAAAGYMENATHLHTVSEDKESSERGTRGDCSPPVAGANGGSCLGAGLGLYDDAHSADWRSVQRGCCPSRSWTKQPLAL